MHHSRKDNDPSMLKIAWVLGSVFALIVLILLFFKATIDIFILILVGALIACYFRGLGNFIHRKTTLSHSASLITSVIGSLLLFLGLFYLVGATIANQTAELEENFPKLIEKAQDFIGDSEVGNRLSSWYLEFETSDKVGDFISGFFKTTFGGFGDIYIILLIGIYFTASPNVYKNGLVQLIPPRGREKAEELLIKLSSNLTKWLFGKFISMSLVFVLTAIALAIVGIPLWLSLAFIAGTLVFIPNFGPIIAAIPTILVALSINLKMAIVVGIIFAVIQISEGSFITPKIQNRLVKIPPALIILGQIFAGTLIGVWGLVFATPLVLILKILVEELYIFPMQEKAAPSLAKTKQKKLPSKTE